MQNKVCVIGETIEMVMNGGFSTMTLIDMTDACFGFKAGMVTVRLHVRSEEGV